MSVCLIQQTEIYITFITKLNYQVCYTQKILRIINSKFVDKIETLQMFLQPFAISSK